MKATSRSHAKHRFKKNLSGDGQQQTSLFDQNSKMFISVNASRAILPSNKQTCFVSCGLLYDYTVWNDEL
jgi:hypothetical protein